MTDISPINQQPMSDDQELAKVLAGISSATDTIDTPDTTIGPVQPSLVPTVEPAAPQDSPVVVEPTPFIPPTIEPALPPAEEPAAEEETTDTTLGTIAPEPLPTPSPLPTSALDDIKKDAIVELRPLVDKLTLAPEEKFDTYLLLLRSTDDKDLIGPAHEAAKNISDETRRAQALLDVIKEIDYLSGQKAA